MNFQIHNNYSGNASSPESSPLSAPAIFVTFSIALAAFIIMGNALVIGAYKTNLYLRTGTNSFLVSLALSDFLVGSVSMPIWIYLTVIDRSLEERKELIDFFKCFDIFSAMASIFHLVAICVERFIAISQPFAHISTRFYQAMITAAWIFATLVSLVYNIEYVKTSYAIVVFVAGFLLPAVVMTFMYGRIFRIARALIKRTPGSQTLENTRNQRISEERKVVITVALVSALFLLAWLPFFLLSITWKFCKRALDNYKSLPKLVIFVKWMHYSNSAVNPMVYAFRDREMRKTFRKLMSVSCKRYIQRREIQTRGLELRREDLVINL